ncbi:Arf-GAP with coiled-coil, ANK repeat and PH domain-containing protein 2 [Actinomortierella ambigua]|nr:Arf-GAP with coiled-coil, ANK repeat and PH domain-containing protein 2 [Actinomortierella ambigua]
METLDLKACKDDTPRFRKQVNDHEDAILALETTARSLLKLTKASVELSEEYSAKQMLIAEEMSTIARSNRGQDQIVTQSLDSFAKALQEVERNRSMMNTQITQMFIEPLEAFVKEEVVPVKELRKPFLALSDEVDTVLHRYMSKRPRDQSIPEASKDVADARKKFHHEYVDYCLRLNELQAKEKFEFMEYLVTLMYTLSSFHHRGHEVLKAVEPSMEIITKNLQETRSRFMEDKPIVKALREETLAIGNENYYPIRPFGNTVAIDTEPSMSTAKTGYLYKKGSQRIMPTWSRRYFEIDGELLTYSTRGKKNSKSDDDPALSINLRVCTVKIIENGDRPYLFEVISPMKVHVLQAENAEEMKEWVNCLQNAITAAHNSDKAPETRGFGNSAAKERHEPSFSQHGGSPNLNGNTDYDKQLLLQVRRIPGNEKCADCRSLSPMWASVNLGTVLCIECSGIHRSLGVHVSKVRSLNLDKWETEAVGVMLALGNEKTNSVFEAKLNAGGEERWITVNSERPEKERFIVAKYIKKEFIEDGESRKEFLTRSVHEVFWTAMDCSDFPEALRCLALGANVDYKNPDHNSMTALHRAIARKDDTAVEFLFQWYSDINATDGAGWSPLHHAIAKDNSKALSQLVRRNAKYDVLNRDGQTPLEMAKALERSEALIVLQIYQFEQQQNELSRPSSAQSVHIGGTPVSHIPSPSPSLPVSLTSPTLVTEPPAGLDAIDNPSPTGAKGVMLDDDITRRPKLSSRYSTGTISLSGTTVASTTPARFSVADARSLAAIGSSTEAWAEEAEAAVKDKASTIASGASTSSLEDVAE